MGSTTNLESGELNAQESMALAVELMAESIYKAYDYNSDKTADVMLVLAKTAGIRPDEFKMWILLFNAL